eukprot:m.61360 g.61360  ORF g.61360 m.61360 type:complete len:499 (-) comp9553_c0_seq1:139-1635(-)
MSFLIARVLPVRFGSETEKPRQVNQIRLLSMLPTLVHVAVVASGGRATTDLGDPVGYVRPRPAADIGSSPWSVGAEVQDRNYSYMPAWQQYLGPLGAKRARIESGWARCEPSAGAYNWGWLDSIVNEMHAVGVKPWVTLSFNNAVYGPAGADPVKYASAGAPLPDLNNATVRAAWARYVQMLTKRYDGVIDEYEIWNEPDIQTSPDIITSAFLNVASPRHGPFAAEALATAKTADPMAFEAIVSTTFHPYTSNPDSTYHEGDVAALLRNVTRASPNMTVLQGECGAPSTQGGYGALTEYKWNETSQAKWALRRLVTDWAHGLKWSSIFSIVDMCYEKDSHLDINHKGLIEINCSTRTVVRRKQAYFAVQHLTALIDGNVSNPGLSWVHTAVGGQFSRVDATRNGAGMVLLWRNTDMPSGLYNYSNATAVTLSLTQPPVSFGDPVLVDLVSGAVFEAGQCSGKATQCTVPSYDAPILLTERAAVPMQPTPSWALAGSVR